MKSYYAIIPANVRYDTRLTANAKLLYGEITALCNEKGFCWATNEYFADLYSVSRVSVSKWISQLAEYGYIKSQIIYREGSKEILKRYLSLVNDPIKENFNTPIKEKFKENNTDFNNTVNIKIYKKFDDFWKAYPKKVGKDAAIKAWNKAKPDIDQVLEALSWQVESDQWNERNGQFIPNPATYLNSGRYKDEQTERTPF